MKLPNYFLADLPPDAKITEPMVREACRALKRNRDQYLASRPTQSLIQLLARVGRDWLDPNDPLRQMALLEGPAMTGFSEPILRSGLEDFLRELTTQNLERLVFQDLGHLQRLDGFVAAETEQQINARSLARGPKFLVQFTAGNIPIPTLMSIVLGLLVRSAQFIKCAAGSSFLPRLFAHSIYAADSKLASCLEIAEWPRGQRELEGALMEEADCVTATGEDETLAAIRQRIPSGCRFLGYGHRVSFAFIGRERLVEGDSLAHRAARDVAAWDQSGCLSPHVVYVQRGGALSPNDFADRLAKELATIETILPRGKLPVAEAARLAARRDFYRIRAGASEATRMWCSEDSTAWTVLFEEDPLFQASCMNRFIYVKATTGLEEVLQSADQVRHNVSTVALAVAESQATAFAERLADWGVSRICPLGRMQGPPLSWRHDGRPALADLVSWTEWEGGNDER